MILTVIFLFTLVAMVSSESNCSLCPGNASPLNGDLAIQTDADLGTITCDIAVELVISSNFTDGDCDGLHLSGIPFTCGCPGVEAGICPGICPDGQPLLNPNITIFGITCGDLDWYAQLSSNETECAEAQQLGAFCGCSGVAPTCSGICSNGQPPPNPNSTIFDAFTCAEYDGLLQFVANETLCAQNQLLGSIFCGCQGSLLPLSGTVPVTRPTRSPNVRLIPAPVENSQSSSTPAPTSAAISLNKATIGLTSRIILVSLILPVLHGL